MGRSGSGSGAEPRGPDDLGTAGTSPRVNQAIEAAVIGLDDVARGVAKSSGGAELRIPGVLAGDRVRAEVVHVDRQGRGHGRLLCVIEGSADRIDPRCVHFLDCGGCDFLHASLEAQHRWKRAHVAEVLELELDRVDPVLASPRAFGYRALAKLVVARDGTLGSYRPRSHDVADMSGCLVHAPQVEVIADAIRAALRTPAGVGATLGLRYVLIRASLEAKRSVVVLVVRSERAKSVRPLVELLAARDDVATVSVHINDSSGDELLGSGPHQIVHQQGELTERIGGIIHQIRPGAFAQVNPLAAARLYEQVVGLADPKDRAVLDLYSGSGGIAFALARAGAKRVTAVEANGRAVEAARGSLALNALGETEIELIESPVETAVSSFEGRTFERVVLNPPRKGASYDALAGILRLRPERIVYVSCEPKTLHRDIGVLLGEGGLELRRVIPVDLFPQTRHVETVALFTASER